ncbi:hypothetical protein V1477_008900 [Vespula maculifrons]|uniref:Uncharacterized protein n=1 Tax=Vespula maculifrons TaxID=7453 RepID=A0ABD2CEB0_VESMC
MSKSYYLQFLSGGSLGMGPWAWASVRVSFQYRKIELDFRTLVLLGTLFDHAGHANFRVESPLVRGSPDAATSKWWDLGRLWTLNGSKESIDRTHLYRNVYSNAQADIITKR